MITNTRSFKVQFQFLDLFYRNQTGTNTLNSIEMDIVIPYRKVKFFKSRLLRDQSSNIMAPFFSQTTGIKNKSQFGDRFDVED